MKNADVTIRIPLPDEATFEDAEALGQLLVTNTPFIAGHRVISTVLVDGNKLGRAGAQALLDQLDGGR